MLSTTRGAALVSVLLASAVLLVVCFSLASIAVLDLNLASNYAARTQGQFIAQAAVNQIMAEIDRAQDDDVGSGMELTEANRLDLAARFERPVFEEGASRFPGEVRVTFNVGQDHYSVDNSSNDGPAAGWMDRGTARKSVPPFCVDLLLGVTVAGRTTWYEALLRRRWPYALASPGHVSLMGTPDYTTTKITSVNSSSIRGSVLNMLPFSFSEKNSDLPPAVKDDNIFVDESVIRGLIGLSTANTAAVNVGGNGAADAGPVPGGFTSTGNLLEGDVDLMAEEGRAVDAPPGNEFTGSVHHGVAGSALQKNLRSAFRLPDVGGYQSVPRQEPPGTGATSAYDPPPPTVSDAVNAKPEGKEFFVLYHDLVLEGPPTDAFQYSPSARFVIFSSAGNRYVNKKKGILHTGAGIELHNCVLAVRGNLDLCSGSGGDGSDVVPALRGTNATIIVDGTLVLNNGSLSASSEGMVIFCRRLVCQAKGKYRGLLMVEKSAAFFPPKPGDSMEIQGAVVSGGAPIIVHGLQPQENQETMPDGSPKPLPPEELSGGATLELQGVYLWSTKLTYDPKYLKTLNRFGPLMLMTLRTVE